MRVLVVEPGADFSVADVHRGWVKALKNLGCQVAEDRMSDRLDFWARTTIDGRKLSSPEVVEHAGLWLHCKLWEWWPDLVIVISGFYVHPLTWTLLKSRPEHKTAVIFTESPYEDDRQLNLVEHADPDVVVLNDPINIEQFEKMSSGKVAYFPHAYDPEFHHPGNETRDCDFAWVGTAYPSRVQFFEQVEWSGLDVRLAGHWNRVDHKTGLLDYVIHNPEHCYPNALAANLYRGAKTSANLYRKEASTVALSEGWAMGPREVELAACRTFFLREPRAEGDELFPMLPTFTTPEEFSDQLHWWVRHDKEREAAAVAAHAAIADRTFDANARRLLTLIGD